MAKSNNKQTSFIKAKVSLLVLFIIGVCSNVQSQDTMFIDQIEGRTITRENFNEKGDLLNKQIFEAGKIINKNGNYEIKVTTELFDKNKIATDKYETSYKCKPDKFSVVVFVFPFANPKSKDTEISSKSVNFKDLYNLKKLNNVEIDLSFDSGLMNFFGSKSTIKIYDRKKEVNGNNLSIKSKINIKAYTLGIRVKQLNYTLTEKLNSDGLLSYQKFVEKDGSYFTMDYK
ncbi:hypothetical protein [uncultured Flavobacterium sp.]|uniref:hypothetical protein n=1 Tax=uncultured Flavobacterium sp. TaxID=165435 RepID=UPI0030EE68BE|tara:strand:+ start:10359 stop:11048 length:690 start_codon:yes stop_codon:yes gene_type:complete